MTREGFASTAQSASLERDSAERSQQHLALVDAIDSLRIALAAKTAAGNAETRVELDRLGAGLQDLADRVDALAQVWKGGSFV